VDEGAQVILGPFYSEEANSAGVAVANSGVSVLAFSNNAAIAGGNVFVLGQTFDNTARRLASYAVRGGKSNILIVHDRNVLAMSVARRSSGAWWRPGGSRCGCHLVRILAERDRSGGRWHRCDCPIFGCECAVFMTADTAGALPLLTQLAGRQRH
jgi:hypothetical protein